MDLPPSQPIGWPVRCNSLPCALYGLASRIRLPLRLAYQRLCARAGRTLDKGRIAMVGDSLHTDILGGLAFGLQTILVTRYGLLRDHNADQVIAQTGIAPDWQVPHL